MARSVRIQRQIVMPFTGAAEGTSILANINPGETLTKIVMQVSWSYFTNVLLEANGGGGLWGVQILGDTESPLTLDLETGLDDDWLWWEGVANFNYAWLRDDVDGDVDDSRWPADGGYRTIKAQRKALEGFDSTLVYFCHKNINPNNIPWTPYVTSSCFILEAP